MIGLRSLLGSVRICRLLRSGDELLSRASVALAQARTAGDGSMQWFDKQSHAPSVATLQLEADLRTAIDDRLLTVHYQPIVSLRTGGKESFEALVRWQHPKRGLLLPDEFIPLAEESEMIRALNRIVLETAVLQLAEDVEHQTQLRDLQRMGCDAAQGFHLGRPLDPSGTTALIAERKAILTAGYREQR